MSNLALSYIVEKLQLNLRKAAGERRVLNDPRSGQRSIDFACVTLAGLEAEILKDAAALDANGALKDFRLFLVEKGRGAKQKLILMAGAHRLQAAITLGWKDIPARVWTDATDDWAELMEIDDNLSGAELTPLDLAVFLARRKAN